MMLCLLERRRFVQAELARELGIEVESLRKRLDDLREAGVPIVRAREGAQVVWSVDARWFPGAALFAKDDAVRLLRLLLRLPQEPTRDEFVKRLLTLPESRGLSTATEVVETPQLAEDEARFLSRVEESANVRRVLRFKYGSTREGASLEWRTVSVQRVLPAHPARFLAWDHDRADLRIFVVHRMAAAELRSDFRFVKRDDRELEEKLRRSADTFDGGVEETLRFSVREDVWRWARDQLRVSKASLEAGLAREGWVPVTLRTSGRVVIARLLVGLGDAVRVESEGLRDEVHALARGALGEGAVSSAAPGASSEGELPKTSARVRWVRGETSRSGAAAKRRGRRG